MSTTNEDDGRLEPWDPSEFEATLLGSIAEDTPPRGSLGKTLSALAAASVTGAAVHVAGVGGVKSLLTFKVLWAGVSLALACGMVGAGLIAGGYLDAPASDAAPASAAPAASTAPAGTPLASGESAPEIASVAVEALPSVEATSAPPVHAPSREAAPATTAAGPSATEREIALLRGVRDDLASGQPAAAVSTLRALERDRAIRLFEPEARVLMIEALIAEGSGDEARERSNAFLRDFPRDPHVARVRSMRDRMSNP